jgi:hypothetical protein
MILGKIRDSAQTKKAKHIRRHARLFQLFSRFWFLKMPFEDAKFSGSCVNVLIYSSCGTGFENDVGTRRT